MDYGVGCRSEWWIGDIDVVLDHPVVAQSLLKCPFIVRPDSNTQIVKQFDDRQRLIRRPVWIDEEFETAAQSRRRVVAFHGAPFDLRFLALATACSCASLRR